jgi:S1-C subfamily serine protease
VWDADEVPAWRRGLYRRVGVLLVACLAVGGLVSYQRADQVAAELAQQRAVAAAPKPVRGPFSDDEVEALASRVTPILVDVETENRSLGVAGAGTGIVLTPSGEVLTNNHVINGADTVEVVTKATGRRYPATVLGYDRNNDVALLRLANPRSLSGAAIGDSTRVRVGEPVLGIGNAGGKGGKPARAPGKVTGLNKSISTSDELTGSTEDLKGLIEVAADIRPGDSGGPLVNEAGQVVGVNTAASISFKTDVPAGTGYAIPIHQAMSIVQVIRAGRSTDQVHVGPTGVLGVAVSGPALRSDGSIRPGLQPGAEVRVVGFGSPAADVGIVEGDTIVGLDGIKIDSPTRLTAVVGRHGPGDRLPIEWDTAAGERRTDTITLVEGPPL